MAKIDEGQSTLLVALDLLAAFDMVQHSINSTWVRLWSSRCSINLDLIISHRSYTVCPTWVFIVSAHVGFHKSQCLMPCYLLQTSLPHPTLHCSLVLATTNMRMTLKCTLRLSPTDINTSVSNLQNCLTAVQLWFSQNGMVINPDKSEVVLF